jgi:uncharacterized OB-fold protein
MSEMKICPNCGEEHYGMFEDCYDCFDCETDYEYEQRREYAILKRKVDQDIEDSRRKHRELWNY